MRAVDIMMSLSEDLFGRRKDESIIKIEIVILYIEKRARFIFVF